jgi:hypothetical protein
LVLFTALNGFKTKPIVFNMKRFLCSHSVICLIAFVSLFCLPLLLQAQIDLPKNKVIKSFPTKANQGVAVDREFYYAIGNLKYIRTEDNVEFLGQAIAWDRFTDQSVLWGIEKRKIVSATQIPLE